MQRCSNAVGGLSTGCYARVEVDVASLYVHAPFCARRCCYCDFAVEVDRSPPTARWLAAVVRELDTIRASGEAPLSPVLDTVYVGGGTPSLLRPEAMRGLRAAIGPERMRVGGLEWTVEANPESLSAETASEWAAAGVNRISLGVQSFEPDALAWMGRLHSPEDACAAVERARVAGIPNLSVDLIFGLPDGVRRRWSDEVGRVLELDVPHISLYGLTAEAGTPLGKWARTGRARMPTDSRYREEYLLAAEAFAEAGYDHYEVSSFARQGFESRHSRACWRGAPYLGLGNSAHSFHGGRRWWNVSDWAAYAAQVDERGRAVAGWEVPSAAERRLESLWLGLRTAEGIATEGLGPAAEATFERWAAAGWAERSACRVRLTAQGWLILDELVLELA